MRTRVLEWLPLDRGRIGFGHILAGRREYGQTDNRQKKTHFPVTIADRNNGKLVTEPTTSRLTSIGTSL
jgi:hypothetical protein